MNLWCLILMTDIDCLVSGAQLRQKDWLKVLTLQKGFSDFFENLSAVIMYSVLGIECNKQWWKLGKVKVFYFFLLSHI